MILNVAGVSFMSGGVITYIFTFTAYGRPTFFGEWKPNEACKGY